MLACGIDVWLDGGGMGTGSACGTDAWLDDGGTGTGSACGTDAWLDSGTLRANSPRSMSSLNTKTP